jgi:hypothetical protein
VKHDAVGWFVGVGVGKKRDGAGVGKNRVGVGVGKKRVGVEVGTAVGGSVRENSRKNMSTRIYTVFLASPRSLRN